MESSRTVSTTRQGRGLAVAVIVWLAVGAGCSFGEPATDGGGSAPRPVTANVSDVLAEVDARQAERVEEIAFRFVVLNEELQLLETQQLNIEAEVEARAQVVQRARAIVAELAAQLDEAERSNLASADLGTLREALVNAELEQEAAEQMLAAAVEALNDVQEDRAQTAAQLNAAAETVSETVDESEDNENRNENKSENGCPTSDDEPTAESDKADDDHDDCDESDPSRSEGHRSRDRRLQNPKPVVVIGRGGCPRGGGITPPGPIPGPPTEPAPEANDIAFLYPDEDLGYADRFTGLVFGCVGPSSMDLLVRLLELGGTIRPIHDDGDLPGPWPPADPADALDPEADGHVFVFPVEQSEPVIRFIEQTGLTYVVRSDLPEIDRHLGVEVLLAVNGELVAPRLQEIGEPVVREAIMRLDAQVRMTLPVRVVAQIPNEVFAGVETTDLEGVPLSIRHQVPAMFLGDPLATSAASDSWLLSNDQLRLMHDDLATALSVPHAKLGIDTFVALTAPTASEVMADFGLELLPVLRFDPSTTSVPTTSVPTITGSTASTSSTTSTSTASASTASSSTSSSSTSSTTSSSTSSPRSLSTTSTTTETSSTSEILLPTVIPIPPTVPVVPTVPTVTFDMPSFPTTASP